LDTLKLSSASLTTAPAGFRPPRQKRRPLKYRADGGFQPRGTKTPATIVPKQAATAPACAQTSHAWALLRRRESLAFHLTLSIRWDVLKLGFPDFEEAELPRPVCPNCAMNMIRFSPPQAATWLLECLRCGHKERRELDRP
jgi:hypothetical protein